MTDLRQAAQAVLDAWDSPLWKTGTTAAKIADLRAALEQRAEPVQERITHITWDERGVRTVNGIPDDAPQRQWVGLTDEDVNRESAPIASQMKLAFHAGMYVAQEILKEKNGLHKD